MKVALIATEEGDIFSLTRFLFVIHNNQQLDLLALLQSFTKRLLYKQTTKNETWRISGITGSFSTFVFVYPLNLKNGKDYANQTNKRSKSDIS